MEYNINNPENINIRIIDSCCVRLTLFLCISFVINMFVITLMIFTPNIKSLLVVKLIIIMSLPLLWMSMWMILSMEQRIYGYGKYLKTKKYIQGLELTGDSIDTSKGTTEPLIKESCMGLSEVYIKYAFSDTNKGTYSGSRISVSYTSTTQAKIIQTLINKILHKCNKSNVNTV